jgi:SAM-dependent methyltransferase
VSSGSDGHAEQGDSQPTARPAYAERLKDLERRPLRRFIDVQAPYRWNLRRLHLCRVLDVGCGLGRNLAHLAHDAVGVDHNPESVRIARERGFTAYTVEEFLRSPDAEPGGYDSLLYAHVLEHMNGADAVSLVKSYLPFLRPGGRVCVITPQERGYRSDATHVEYVDFDGIRHIAEESQLVVEKTYSFPLPRVFGTVFTYNEFVAVCRA